METINVVSGSDLSGAIQIYGLAFELNCGRGSDGSLRLNSTHSYTTEAMVLPSFIRYGDPYLISALLLDIMRYVNTKFVLYYEANLIISLDYSILIN